MATRGQNGFADFEIAGRPYKAVLDEFVAYGEDMDRAGANPDPSPSSRVPLSFSAVGIATKGGVLPTFNLKAPGPRTGMGIIVRSTNTKDRFGVLSAFEVRPEGGLTFRVADEGIASSFEGPAFRGAKLRVWFGGNRLTVRIPAGAATRNPDGSFSGELMGSWSYFAEFC